MKIIITTSIITLFSLNLFSQEKNETLNFIGVVQYSKGDIQLSPKDAKDQRKIHFKTFVHTADKFSLSKGNRLKIITQSKCVLVAYGPGELQAPANEQSSTWAISEASSRVICGAAKTQNINLDGSLIKLSNSEFFYHDKKLLLRKGSFKADSKEHTVIGLYEKSDKGWKYLEDKSKDLAFTYDFNDQLPQPVESIIIEEPRGPRTSRWIMGPTFGRASMNHSVELHKIVDPIDMEDLRLTHIRNIGSKTYIFDINFIRAENPESDNYCNDGGPWPPPAEVGGPRVCNSAEGVSFDVGWRLKGQHDWSWLVKTGINFMKFSFEDTPNGGHFRSEFIGLSFAAGVDRMFKITDTFGIYTSAEALLVQTLTNTDVYLDCDSCGSPTFTEEQKENFGLIGLQFYLGGMLSF